MHVTLFEQFQFARHLVALAQNPDDLDGWGFDTRDSDVLIRRFPYW